MALAPEFCDLLGPPVAASFAARSACTFCGLDEEFVKFFCLDAVWIGIRDELFECLEEVIGIQMVELGIDVYGIRFLFFGPDISTWERGESLGAIAEQEFGIEIQKHSSMVGREPQVEGVISAGSD